MGMDTGCFQYFDCFFSSHTQSDESKQTNHFRGTLLKVCFER